jgi:hypothetical protein
MGWGLGIWEIDAMSVSGGAVSVNCQNSSVTKNRTVEFCALPPSMLGE